MKILDLGCGSRKYEVGKNDEVIGIDRNKNSQSDILHDLEKIPYPFKDGEFDVIYASHVLEHLKEPIYVLKECKRLLKNKGKIIIKTPHFSSSWSYALVHEKYFSAMTFNMVSCLGLKINKMRINWLMKSDSYKRKQFFLIKFISIIIDYLANKNIHFCERFWCYYVGGFSEIEVEMIKK